jgi:hypothetical protein
MSTLKFNKVGTPDTPASNKALVYVKNDGLYYLDETGTEVKIMLATDVPNVDLGSAILYHPESPYQKTDDLTLANFPTWINQANATISVPSAGGLLMEEPAEAANELHVRYKSMVYSSNYKITFMVKTTAWGQYNRFGITLQYSGSNKLLFFGLMVKDDGPYLAAHKYTDSTTFDGVYLETIMRGIDPPHWYQLHDDGTYWRWKWSSDGINFVECGTTLRNDWWSPNVANRVGFAINGERSADFGIKGWFRSFKEESA